MPALGHGHHPGAIHDRAQSPATLDRKLAEAAITHAAPKGFPLDPALLDGGLLVLTTLAAFAGSIAADVLKDVIKERLKKLIDRKFPDTPKPDAEVTILDSTVSRWWW